MSAQSNAPIIIKKVKKVSGEGHHGGAWKVAYADFVTAMMAFFMLMWLLNATTEKQRKGIADYFSPTIPIVRISGGGDGSFGGDSVFTEEMLSQTGQGGLPTGASGGDTTQEQALAEQSAAERDAQSLHEIGDVLTGRSGESMVSSQAQRHIVTKVTDEGLVIEVFDIEGDPLFDGETATPTPVMQELAEMFARVFGLVHNGVAVGGHVSSQPIVVVENTAWSLSAERADAIRVLLESNELDPERVMRVTGFADREPATTNPMAVRNNRIELILLRSDQG